MGCEVDTMWSLSSLVGAFLDLAIAYFFLCASSVVFFGTKFLAFFGLHLPCPCNGLFGIAPNRNLCLKRLLVDFPSEKVSNVQLDVKGKFPFNNQNCHLNLRLIGEKDNIYVSDSHGILEMEGKEASCSSVSDLRKSRSVPRIQFKPKGEIGFARDGRAEVKGKGVMNYKSRVGMIRRRRKRASAVDHWASSSVSSHDPMFVDFQSGPTSPPSINNERSEESKDLYGNGVYGHHTNHKLRRFGQRDSFELDGFPEDDEQTEKNVSSYEEPKVNAQMERRPSNDDKSTIRLMELALEEEQAARASLYLELEKERNAAASAADEAMAMILRLQEEKASIEMEARQYQRIIEEKSNYDAEEMNILKEILVRRETENHFLEKEVEAYRQMIHHGNGDEHILDDERQLFNSSLDEDEDPILMLHQLSASIDKNILTKSNRLESSTLEWNEDSSFQKQVGPASNPRGTQEFQEKEMVTMINDSNVSQSERETLDITSQSCQPGFSEHKFAEKTISLTDQELHVHDVHVIHDGSKPLSTNINLKSTTKSNLSSEASSTAQMIDVIRDTPSTSSSGAEMELKSKRSSSDIINKLPPIGPKAKRHSMSATDIERLKIEYEIETLRERLKVVHEGREKLSLSVENREGEKLQLKLLEDIAHQLQEIRHLTGPGKALRQASLPSPSSKVTTKKKRCRSVSVGVQNSS